MKIDITTLPEGWRPLDATICARYRTGDFATGLSFVQQVGELAEEADHHPDVTLTFPTVEVLLISHDVGEVTDRDLALAGRITQLATERGLEPDLERTHEVSAWVPASPEDVYALVSNVPRTGEWSPTCRSAEWHDPAQTGVGALFTGHNDDGKRQWTSTSKVTAAEPGKRFEWEVNDGATRWGYVLAPHEGGTLVTHTWHFTERGHAFFMEKFPKPLVGMAKREQAARKDMPITLTRIARLLG